MGRPEVRDNEPRQVVLAALAADLTYLIGTLVGGQV